VNTAGLDKAFKRASAFMPFSHVQILPLVLFERAALALAQ
jgi:hypothetical protein